MSEIAEAVEMPERIWSARGDGVSDRVGYGYAGVWVEENDRVEGDAEYVRADLHATLTSEASGEVEALRAAVRFARDVFDDYERLHHAKDTSDGYAKAATNRAHKNRMEAALGSPK